jgi:hypothetical protein
MLAEVVLIFWWVSCLASYVLLIERLEVSITWREEALQSDSVFKRMVSPKSKTATFKLCRTKSGFSAKSN